MKQKLLDINIVLTIFLLCSLITLLSVFATVFMFSVKALPFWESQDFAINYGAKTITYGDFNNDGYDDFAVVSEMAVINVYMNDGSGAFPSTPTTQITNSVYDPLDIVTADFNGDNYDDIAIANNAFYEELEFFVDYGSVAVFLSNGDGTFSNSNFQPNGYTSFECYLNTGVCDLFHGINVGDYDNDSDLDIAATDTSQNKLVVFANDGNATFSVANSFSIGNGAMSIKSADIDNDNNLDLIIANYDDKDVSAFFGAGDNSFSGRVDSALTINPFSLATGDFDDDGITDIACSGYLNKYLDRMSVLLGGDDGSGNGNGSFTESYNYIYDTGSISTLWGAQFSHIYQKELNGDDIPDLALIVSKFGYNPTFTGVVAYLYSNGDGTFTPAGHYVVSKDPTAMAITDFNNDNNLDAVVSAYVQGSTDYKFNLIYGIDGNGLGAMGVYRLGNDPGFVYSADFNNDGNNDLAVANYYDSDVGIFLGYGNGAFAKRVDYAVGAGAQEITGDDFDNDGILDLAVATYPNSKVAILLGNGDGTFAAFSAYDATITPKGIISDDFNGDNYPDVAVIDDSYTGTAALAVLFNNGDGSLAPPVTYDTLREGLSIKSGDLDNDGDHDLVVVGNWNVLIENGSVCTTDCQCVMRSDERWYPRRTSIPLCLPLVVCDIVQLTCSTTTT